MDKSRRKLFLNRTGRTFINIGIILIVIALLILVASILTIIFSFLFILCAIIFTIGLVFLDPNFMAFIKGQNEFNQAVMSTQVALPYLLVGSAIFLVFGIILVCTNKQFRLSRVLGFGMKIEAKGCLIKYKGGYIVITLDPNAPTTEIKIKSSFVLDTPRWIPCAIYYWFIGILGFFTPKYERYFPEIDCSLTVKPDSVSSNAKIGIAFKHSVKNETSMALKTANCQIIEKPKDLVLIEDNTAVNWSQKFQTNHDVRRHTRLVKKLSRFSRLAAVVAAVVYIVILVL